MVSDSEFALDISLALRVGITGHGPHHLPHELLHVKEQVVDVLSQIRHITASIAEKEKAVFRKYAPKLQLISPLADGADQLVAEEAKKLGFLIHAVLPYSREEYRKELIAKDEFDALLEFSEKSGSILELDAAPQSDESYERVGRVMFRQSDIVIAIWDPEAPEKRGGTAQIANEAFESGLALIWIDPSGEQPWCFANIENRRPVHGPGSDHLEAHLQHLLGLTDLLDNPKAIKGLNTYVNREKLNRWCGLGSFRWIVSLFSLRWPFGNPLLPKLRWTNGAWKRAAEIPELLARKPLDMVVGQYLRADHLANKYANLYRDSFTYIYILAPTAIAAAIWSSNTENQFLLGLIEFLSLMSALIVFIYAHFKRFHERWMDYRLLAERLRHLISLLPINRVPLLVSGTHHRRQSNVRGAWVDWYFKAILRETGVYGITMSDSYLEEYRDWLKTQVVGQIQHHEKNHKKLSKIHHLLTAVKIFIFTLAAVLALTHVVPGFHHGLQTWLPTFTNEWILFWAIVLPAVAAALHAWAAQGEIEHTSDRSEKLVLELESQLNKINQEVSANAFELGNTAEIVSGVMAGELTDWHVVFAHKGVPLP